MRCCIGRIRLEGRRERHASVGVGESDVLLFAGLKILKTAFAFGGRSVDDEDARCAPLFGGLELLGAKGEPPEEWIEWSEERFVGMATGE